MKRSLNCNYRLVWNETLQELVVVSELSKARGKWATGVTQVLATLVLSCSATFSAYSATVVIAEDETQTGLVADGSDDIIQIEQLGTSEEATLTNGGTQNNGGSAVRTQIGSGGVENVLDSGGSADAVISDGGLQNILAGGNANGSTILLGGTQVINGGTADNTQVYGLQEASDGSIVTYSAVYDGGIVNISGSNARAQYFTVSNGGVQNISDGARSIFGTIEDGGIQNLSNGASSIRETINFGGVQNINDGSSANNLSLSGTQNVNNGGNVSSTTVLSGGIQNINDGGTSDQAIIEDGGVQNIYSGGITRDDEILLGGTQNIIGGIANNSIVNGSQNLSNGGTANSTTINNGASQIVNSGGTAFGTIVNSGGSQSINNEGNAISTRLQSGATAAVNSGGTATATRVEGGAVQQVSGGTAVSSIITTDGLQIISNSGKATGSQITGSERVENGGSTTSSVVNANGNQTVNDGGSTADTVVNSGGVQLVNSGGLTSGTILNNTGIQIVEDAGTANDTVVNSDGQQQVNSGGVANNTRVNSGGVQELASGATASGAQLLGGTQNVNSGATASDTDIGTNGIQNVFAGSQVDRSMVNGGTQNILSGAQTTNTVVNNGGIQNVVSGGTSLASVLNSGGVQNINDGGTASDAVVSAGGKQIINNGGTATSTTIQSGGYQTVNAGGVSELATVLASATQDVIGGTASDTNLSGTQRINAGGTATSTVVNSGGIQEINNGGIATGSIINNGGLQTINQGGKADNSVIADGGTIRINSGGAGQTLSLESGGMLEVLHGGSASGVQQNTGGAIITDTDTAISGDHAGGAFEIDSTTHIANNLLLENGGLLYVLEDGFATSSTVNSGGRIDVTSGGVLYGTNTFNDGASLVGQAINNGTLSVSADTEGVSFGGDISGAGSIVKTGTGALNLKGSLVQNGGIQLQSGSLIMDALSAVTDITAELGTTISLINNSVLTGTVDPADMNIDSGSTWVMTGSSVLTDLTLAGSINVQTPTGSFTPKTLTVTNLTGNGGNITLNSVLQGSDSQTDKLVIDGGVATGNTQLSIRNNGGLGAKTEGNGILVVNAVNGATTASDAFSMNTVQAGAYSYNLFRGTSDENWYLSSQEALNSMQSNYRSAMFLYNSMFAQAMDYDSQVVGSLDSRRYASRSPDDENNAFWGRIQAGQLQHRNGESLGNGNTPDSKGGYTFLQLGSDLFSRVSADESMRWTGGVYAATGLSAIDVQRDSGGKAGTVRDTVYTLGGYITGVHQSGWWVDTVLQGSRHNMESQPVDSSNFTSRGWGYIASIETGMPFSLTESLYLEPQVQYQYRSLNLKDGNDNAADINFDNSSTQQVRAGLKLGNNHRAMQKTDKHVPVSWWMRPSVVQNFATDGSVTVSAPGVDGSSVTFNPDQDGTAVAMDVGLDGQIHENVTLGVRAGYTVPVNDGAAGGYGGQINLKIRF